MHKSNTIDNIISSKQSQHNSCENENRSKSSSAVVLGLLSASEIWMDIEGYEGLYQVSNLGRVKALSRYEQAFLNKRLCNFKEKILKPYTMQCGYKRIHLSKKGIIEKLLVHRIVAKTFIINDKNLPQINHKNGIKNDNRVENLEWVTGAQNVQHAFSVLNHQAARGEKQGSSKLKNNQIIEIRLLKNIKTQRDIAGLYNVDPTTISAIFRNLTWTHI